MTEKNVKTGKMPFAWPPFLLAFLVAPLLGTLPAIVFPIVGIMALTIGYPVYLVVGAPVLIWYLRRNPPLFLPIILLGGVAQMALFPFGFAFDLIYPDAELLRVMVSLLLPAVVFGMLWAASFTLIYRSLLREW